MTETTQLPDKFKFMRPVLQVLSDGEVWPTVKLRKAVIETMELTPEQTAVRLKSGQPVAENRVGWALYHVTRAKAVEKVEHGRSRITEYGLHLLNEHPVEISADVIRSSPGYDDYTPRKRRGTATKDSDDLATYWFVGAVFADDDSTPVDHTEEFREQGVWRANQPHKYADLIRSMKQGERIAIKAAFTRKNDLPFDIDGRTASVMAIKATGTITANLGDGNSVEVEWDPVESAPSDDWYFWTNRNTVWGIKADHWKAEALIKFTFEGEDQDYDAFLSDPYWVEKYSDPQVDDTPETKNEETEQLDPADVYGIRDVIDEGCFISSEVLEGYLNSLKRKKNLVLQGPPGTGKTWLAKRLAYALIGSKDRSLIHAVQFHPTVSYEDFVRGWRPGGDGRLTLTDGYFLKVIEAAQNQPGVPHVLVIEEVNRANLAQVMGELLTLLEADKRKASEALKLAYSKPGDDLVYIPDNLYVIGTMNLADRSLAIVDFALRRRFAFADLLPQFNDAWRKWVHERNGIDPEFLGALGQRIEVLNRRITEDRSLGAQYSIGHSFFTPSDELPVDDPQAWLIDVVEQEIRPLLAEYWFDDPARVDDEAAALIGRP